MKRRMFIVAACAAAAVVSISAAMASPPLAHSRLTYSNSGTDPAGVFCDVPIYWTTTLDLHYIILEGTRYIEHYKRSETYTNLDTGYTLIGSSSLNDRVTSESVKEMGLFLRLQETSGKTVAVLAGQAVFDWEDGFIKVTPHFETNPRPTICTALGANPV